MLATTTPSSAHKAQGKRRTDEGVKNTSTTYRPTNAVSRMAVFQYRRPSPVLREIVLLEVGLGDFTEALEKDGSGSGESGLGHGIGHRFNGLQRYAPTS